jgi:hypothetical protein
MASACGATSPPHPQGGGGTPGDAPLPAIARPEWHAGDRWTYDWTAGNERGTKIAEVVDVRDVGGVRYYILRIGDVDQYYTIDLRWAAAVRDGKVEARMSPPQPWLVWPLTAGQRWPHEGTWEDRDGRRPTKEVFSVVGPETVEVPAGRFSAVKVVRDGGAGVSDEYWYVPAIRWYARWIGRRSDTSFEERLTAYRPARQPPSDPPLPGAPRPPAR